MHYDLLPDILTMRNPLEVVSLQLQVTFAGPYFQNAYGNLNDAILHSTTYNGFGEETVTSIEALNIILDDAYVLKSKEFMSKLILA